MKIKKIMLAFLMLFVSANTYAQSTKKIAINTGFSTNGVLISGLQFTKPLTAKLAISLSVNALTNSNTETNTNEDIYIESGYAVFPARLDISYRILETPLNVYVGGGADLGFNGEFTGALGVSYGWKNFAFYTELFTYSEYQTYDSYYYYEDFDYSENGSHTALAFGLRWFFK